MEWLKNTDAALPVHAPSNKTCVDVQLGVDGGGTAGAGLDEEDDEGADGAVEEGVEEGAESDGDEDVEATVSGAGGIGSGTN